MQHMIEQRDRLRAQITSLSSEMDRITPEAIEKELRNKLQEEVSLDPDSTATKKAGQALQAAQAGTDAASLERQLLTAKREVLAGELAIVERNIAAAERDIAVAQKVHLDTLLADAQAQFTNAVDAVYRSHIFLVLVATKRFQHDAALRGVDNINWCAIPDQFLVTVPSGTNGLPDGAGVRHRMHSADIISQEQDRLDELFSVNGW